MLIEALLLVVGRMGRTLVWDVLHETCKSFQCVPGSISEVGGMCSVDFGPRCNFSKDTSKANKKTPKLLQVSLDKFGS